MARPVNPVVIIPARLASTRLPDKPLADIAGKPMIVHVLERAREADVGPVVVACGDAEIAEAVRARGGDAVMTRPDHSSGSDRIFEALSALDGERFDVVVNLQGDVPVIERAAIHSILEPFVDPAVDIVTLVTELAGESERDDPNVVKAQVQFGPNKRIGRALAFSRDPAQLKDPLFHHIGMYAYRREALARFVALPPAERELGENLEQLRALEAGMRIEVVLVDGVPIEVNTPADLERVRAHVSAHQTASPLEP